MASEKNITLCSLSGTKILVDKSVIKLSSLISEMIEDDDHHSEIPIPISVELLQKVVDYCDYYKNVPIEFNADSPISTTDLSKMVTPKWYVTFIDLSHTEIFDLIKVANYLGIESLLELGCLKIACILKNKNPEEIRQCFNIQDSFTPEEKAIFISAHSWIRNALP